MLVKQTFGVSIAISAGVVGLLMLAKLLVSKISPEFFAADVPFWDWDIGLYSWISYIFTCIIQEFLARSMIYGSIRKMYDGKHGTWRQFFFRPCCLARYILRTALCIWWRQWGYWARLAACMKSNATFWALPLYTSS